LPVTVVDLKLSLVSREKFCFVGFEVLIMVVMRSSVLWHITPCSPLKFNWPFGGTCYPHLQGLRVSQRQFSACCLLHAGFLLGFDAEDGGDISPKHGLTFSGLCSVISRKIELFKLCSIFRTFCI
jgi:hypothetical protein